MIRDRLPLPERFIARLFLDGEACEFVIGDLLERHERDRRDGVDPIRARARLLRQTVGSCVAWRRHGVVGRLGVDSDAGRGGDGMRGWVHDVRIAARSLKRRPGFAVAVAVTLGLGVGATTAIFSVVDAVVLRPLAYDEAGRLAAVGATFPTREWADEEAGLQHLAGINLRNFRDFAARTRSFSALAAVEATNALFPDQGSGPELVPAARVSYDFFDLMDASPTLGRMFVPDEFRAGADGVVLLTHGAWQRRFAADPDIVGRPLGAAGSSAIVVGVLPRTFEPPEAFFATPPEVWMPLVADHPRYESRGMRSLYVVGRLAPGVDIEHARDEARAIATTIAADHPDGNVYPDGSHFGIGVNSLHAETVGTAGRTLNIWVGAATLLLLLSGLNAASLLLVRAMDRTRELGVRVALGAGRRRVVRLMLTEASLLALTGAAIGVALAYAGVDLFVRFAPPEIPRVDGVAVDARVLGVAVALSLGAGLAAGLTPLFRLRRGVPWARPGGTGRTVAEGRSRARSILVSGQLAVAMLLLTGAGLLTNSFLRIMAVDPGFEPEGLVTLNIGLKRPGAPDGEESWQAWDAALRELRSVPGVDAVAGTTNPPFQAPFWAPRIILPGDPPGLRREGIAGYAVTPNYLETVGTGLVAGRGIEPLDGPDSEPVMLVNEAFVRTVLGGEDPIGLVVRQSEGDARAPIRIVGVVRDVVQASADEGARPAVYLPYTQTDWPLVQAVVRSSRSPDVLIPELRKAVARFSPIVPPRDVRTMRQRMSDTRVGPRFQALLVGAFAMVALLLATSGLYASLAHAVGRRRRELGVRMALGAPRGGVLRMILREGLTLAGAGVVVGLIGGWWGTRLLTGFLYGVAPHDVTTLLAVSVTLLAVAVLACLNPARRATAVDPVEVLRAE